MKTMFIALMTGLMVACASPTAPTPSMGGGKKKARQCCLGGLKSSLETQRLHPDRALVRGRSD